MTNKLTKQQWKEIEIRIKKNPDINITGLAREYDISRNSIYVYGKKRGWFKKLEIVITKKKGIFERVFGK